MQSEGRKKGQEEGQEERQEEQEKISTEIGRVRPSGFKSRCLAPISFENDSHPFIVQTALVMADRIKHFSIS